MIPPRLQGTDPLVGWLNKLRDEVAANKINSIVGASFSRGPGGTNIAIGSLIPGKVVYVKCCLTDGSTAYLPVLVLGTAYTDNAGTTTDLAVTSGNVPTGAEVLE